MAMKENFLGKGSQTIIGMVHCLPLPGTYGFDGDYNKIIEQKHSIQQTCIPYTN